MEIQVCRLHPLIINHINYSEFNNEQLVAIQEILERYQLSEEQINKIIKELPYFAVPDMVNGNHSNS